MKKIPIILVCVVLAFGVYVVAGTHGILTPFWKVTDPSDSRFDPIKFEFVDYRDLEEITHAFRVLFPPGTPKTFVDQVLVNSGNAKISQTKSLPGLWHYADPHLDPRMWGYPSGPVYQFIFDKDLTVENIIVLPPEYLYPDRVTKDDLRTKRLNKEN